jgi:aryl-alcohol dehydrogenase-like predicted oxidoreductase
MSETSELERLNEGTFRAEARLAVGGQAWSDYLDDVLDETFVLRRSRADREDEDKAAMLAAVAAAESPPERTLVPGSVRAWSDGSLGVVASVVTLPVEGETKAFANVKVFARGEDGRFPDEKRPGPRFSEPGALSSSEPTDFRSPACAVLLRPSGSGSPYSRPVLAAEGNLGRRGHHVNTVRKRLRANCGLSDFGVGEGASSAPGEPAEDRSEQPGEDERDDQRHRGAEEDEADLDLGRVQDDEEQRVQPDQHERDEPDDAATVWGMLGLGCHERSVTRCAGREGRYCPAVRTVPFPALDRPVSCLALGAAAWTHEERGRAQELTDAFLDLGGAIFDTARAYGESEAVVGACLAERRDEAIVLTKGGHHALGRFGRGLRRRVTRRDVGADLRASLAALGLERVDVYLLHRDDPRRPVGPIVAALNGHLRAGEIRSFGGSNWTPERFDAAAGYARDHDLEPFTSSSPQLSLAAWTESPWPECVTARDGDALAWYERTQMPLLAWSPLGAGFFAETGDPAVVRVYGTEANRERRRLAAGIGRAHGASAAQVALAWLWARPFPVVPVVGARTVAELREAAEAADLSLSEEELARLDGVDG